MLKSHGFLSTLLVTSVLFAGAAARANDETALANARHQGRICGKVHTLYLAATSAYYRDNVAKTAADWSAELTRKSGEIAMLASIYGHVADHLPAGLGARLKAEEARLRDAIQPMPNELEAIQRKVSFLDGALEKSQELSEGLYRSRCP